MIYKDELLPTRALLEGDSEIVKDIAMNVRDWAGNWDAVLDNIEARGEFLWKIVERSRKTGNKELLEAPFVSKAIDQYYEIVKRLKENKGFVRYIVIREGKFTNERMVNIITYKTENVEYYKKLFLEFYDEIKEYTSSFYWTINDKISDVSYGDINYNLAGQIM